MLLQQLVEARADLALNGLRLAEDHGWRAHPAGHDRLPELVRLARRSSKATVSTVTSAKPASSSSWAKRLSSAKRKNRRPGREIRRRRRPGLADGVEHHAEVSVALGSVPDRGRHPAADREDPRELGGDALGAGQVEEEKPGDGSVEAPVLERQLLGVGLSEVDPRVLRARAFEHRLGDVAPRRLRPTRCGPRGDLAGPVATSRTHAPGNDARGVEEWFDHPAT